MDTGSSPEPSGSAVDPPVCSESVPSSSSSSSSIATNVSPSADFPITVDEDSEPPSPASNATEITSSGSSPASNIPSNPPSPGPVIAEPRVPSASIATQRFFHNPLGLFNPLNPSLFHLGFHPLPASSGPSSSSNTGPSSSLNAGPSSSPVPRSWSSSAARSSSPADAAPSSSSAISSSSSTAPGFSSSAAQTSWGSPIRRNTFLNNWGDSSYYMPMALYPYGSHLQAAAAFRRANNLNDVTSTENRGTLDTPSSSQNVRIPSPTASGSPQNLRGFNQQGLGLFNSTVPKQEFAIASSPPTSSSRNFGIKISRLECGVCFTRFSSNRRNRHPIVAGCGHSFCRRCAPQLQGRCATCRSPFRGEQNYALVGALEELKELRNQTRVLKERLRDAGQPVEEDESSESGDSEPEDEVENPGRQPELIQIDSDDEINVVAIVRPVAHRELEDDLENDSDLENDFFDERLEPPVPQMRPQRVERPERPEHRYPTRLAIRRQEAEEARRRQAEEEARQEEYRNGMTGNPDHDDVIIHLDDVD